MLDLDKMQRELDELLARETTESLLAWLRKKRMQRFGSFFGEGEYVPYYGQSLAFLLKNQISTQIVDGGEDFVGDKQLGQAA